MSELGLRQRCRCNDVSEAVALARILQEAGMYQWFRGQRNNWPVRAQFARLETAAERDDEKARIGRFGAWVANTPGLESLADRTHDILAIGQHHGLKTMFIDFTTDVTVAGFFATRNCSKDAHDGVIICLNRADLEEFWQAMPKTYSLEFLEPDVANLWRLQAQAGVFLFTNVDDPERLYGFDRIFFPCTGPTGEPSEPSIFPARSNMENLLMQFFMNEVLRAGNATWRELDSGGDWDTVVLPEAPIGLSDHPTWSADALAVWLHVPVERFNDLPHRTLLLAIDSTQSPRSVAIDVESQVLDYLRDPLARLGLTDWKFVDAASVPAHDFHTDGLELVSVLWSGLRRLPYEDVDLAASVAALVGLALTGVGRRWAGFIPGHFDASRYEDCIAPFMRNPEAVEFSASDGSYGRGFVSLSELEDAIRTDLRDMLAASDRTPELIEMLSGPAGSLARIRGLLVELPRPQALFEFPKFARLFVRQLLPTLLLTRQPDPAVYYSPARLTRFGLA